MANSFVLLIEDNPADAELATNALRSLGIPLDIEHRASGEDGLRLLAEVLKRPAPPPSTLIVLDLALPGIDGLDVLRQFKQFPSTQHIPVVVCSASDNPDRIELALTRHANALIRKSDDLDRFLAALSHVAESFLVHSLTPKR